MKTNHQRGFKDTRSSRAVFADYDVFSESRHLPLSDRTVSAVVNCSEHTNGKRGIAKDRKGAKKYMNSRTRFHENAALQTQIKRLGGEMVS